jgi:hypothetical protein
VLDLAGREGIHRRALALEDAGRTLEDRGVECGEAKAVAEGFDPKRLSQMIE